MNVQDNSKKILKKSTKFPNDYVILKISFQNHSKISRPTKISSAKKFQKFRKSAQLWLVNKSRSWTAVPFLNHVQNREGFADGQRTAADVNDLLFELDRPSSPSLTVLIRSFRPVPNGPYSIGPSSSHVRDPRDDCPGLNG